MVYVRPFVGWTNGLLSHLWARISRQVPPRPIQLILVVAARILPVPHPLRRAAIERGPSPCRDRWRGRCPRGLASSCPREWAPSDSGARRRRSRVRRTPSSRPRRMAAAVARWPSASAISSVPGRKVITCIAPRDLFLEKVPGSQQLRQFRADRRRQLRDHVFNDERAPIHRFRAEERCVMVADVLTDSQGHQEPPERVNKNR